MRDLELFAQAIEIDDISKRSKFLHAACGGDRKLLKEIERLLDAYSRAGSVLEEPLVAGDVAGQLVAGPIEPHAVTNYALQPTASLTANQSEPTNDTGEPVLGPYRLLEKIGEGGFGQVFVAAQSEPVRRQVAVKIIKPGMDSKEVIARFNAERQALALMDHPHIAKIFDGGTTERGLPYFVMELVRGIPITDYCDKAQLDIHRRLKLFVDTCRAIQHAHQKGVIHRDIKPSNVMITLHDGEPVVKVIDFGVAKALNQRLTDSTIYTRFSFMIGTPAYMSPEQAVLSGLDIDTRSDIYSLGVLLYELMAGSPPFYPDRFSKISIDEMRRIIREEEPQRPSTRVNSLTEDSSVVALRRSIDVAKLRSALAGDLDWIVMKALAKDRSRRYESASGLAADVQRYLDGDAVLARPPTLGFRISRFVRKNRGWVIAASLILCALLLGIAASLSFAWWAVYEREVARKQEGIAEDKSKEARMAAQRATRAEEDAVRSLLESRIAFARLNIGSRRPGQQFQSLAAIREAVELAKRTGSLEQHTVDLRTQAIAALTRLDLRLTQSIPTSEVSYQQCARSADLRRIAFRIREAAGDAVTVRSTDQLKKEEMRVPIPYDTRADFHDSVELTLSPNGRFLFVGSIEHGVMVWDLELNRQVLFVPSGELRWLNWSFMPDSRHLITVWYSRGTNTRSVRMHELLAGELAWALELPESGWGHVVPSGDGRYLATTVDQRVIVLAVEDRSTVAELPLPDDPIGRAIAWSASGTLLATATQPEIWIWDVSGAMEAFTQSAAESDGTARQTTPDSQEAKGPKPVTVLRGHTSHIPWMRFHPRHESLLASTSWDGTTRLWIVFTASEQLVMNAGQPEFSGDGK